MSLSVLCVVVLKNKEDMLDIGINTVDVGEWGRNDSRP